MGHFPGDLGAGGIATDSEVRREPFSRSECLKRSHGDLFRKNLTIFVVFDLKSRLFCRENSLFLCSTQTLCVCVTHTHALCVFHTVTARGGGAAAAARRIRAKVWSHWILPLLPRALPRSLSPRCGGIKQHYGAPWGPRAPKRCVLEAGRHPKGFLDGFRSDPADSEPKRSHGDPIRTIFDVFGSESLCFHII